MTVCMYRDIHTLQTYITNIKFHVNPSSGSRVFFHEGGQTDRET